MPSQFKNCYHKPYTRFGKLRHKSIISHILADPPEISLPYTCVCDACVCVAWRYRIYVG